MLTTSVLRKQYAVGHGGFHGGKITVRKDDAQIPNLLTFDTEDPTGVSTTILEKFYVYDCGSESPIAFDRSLRSHVLSTKEHTDILFVSHLDSDHVNKIDRLMGATSAEVVVLPYLESADLAELLARELDDGIITGSIRDYVSDPIDWWLRRGTKTVIFVEPESGDAQPPQGGIPDRPIDPEGPVPPSSSEAPEARLTCIIRKPRGLSPKGFASIPTDAALDVDRELPQGGVLAGSGSYFRLEWRASGSDRWRLGDWILLPYVHPVQSSVRDRFQKAIMEELGLKNPDSATFASALLEKLRSDRKKLVSLYSDSFEVGQNAISMSLYSGPERPRGSPNSSDWLSPAGPAQIGYNMVASAVGWLGTGDSKLKQSARRTPWLSFFKPFSSQILIISLPHHGSSKDFHGEILNFDGLRLAVATTIRDRNRVAGLEDTLGQVKFAGKQYQIVDDSAEAEFSFVCARPMKPV